MLHRLNFSSKNKHYYFIYDIYFLEKLSLRLQLFQKIRIERSQ